MVVFMIDADNLSSSAWIEEAFQRLEAAEGSISVRRAYGSPENLKGLTDVMRAKLIRPFVNLALQKNTTDIALAVDAMELACQTPRPTTVVIGSGDADFVPLVVRLQERDIRMVCVTERARMAPEAAAAYNKLVFVGATQEVAAPQLPAIQTMASQLPISIAAQMSQAPTKKTLATKVAAPTVPTKNVPAKKAPAKKTIAKKASTAPAAVTCAGILRAAPALTLGKWQRLGEIAKLLHDEKLLSKNATSTKLFKKFPSQFEMAPLKQHQSGALYRTSVKTGASEFRTPAGPPHRPTKCVQVRVRRSGRCPR